jgi:hypothetical protein
MTGYKRTADFGAAWLDENHNGCDTRDDILARDLTSTVHSGKCKVLTGALVSPYTGATIDFVRGEKTSALVQIDHLVSLGDAWETGAQQLNELGRELLANDPLELLAVDGRSNDQKGDGDAATWLPANTSFRCEYGGAADFGQVGIRVVGDASGESGHGAGARNLPNPSWIRFAVSTTLNAECDDDCTSSHSGSRRTSTACSGSGSGTSHSGRRDGQMQRRHLLLRASSRRVLLPTWRGGPVLQLGRLVHLLIDGSDEQRPFLRVKRSVDPVG